MSKAKIKKIIKFLENCLKENGLHINKIILFGSCSKNQATPESDLDIVIVSNNFKNKNIFEKVELIKEAERKTIKKFMVPLDIVTMTPEELDRSTSIVSDYAREGEIINTA